MKRIAGMIAAALIAASAQAAPPAAVIADPPVDAAHPAGMAAFVIPARDGATNAVMYTAAGIGPHPTLVLFHGFPGNEQNLDLAQAARRAGWNVLTLHYRGSWGSPGAFSLHHAAEDADTALAFVRSPAAVATYHVDPAHIAVAGHSMGGFMAAHAAADDSRVVGAFLIDPWDIAADGRSFADPKAREAFVTGELRGDLQPLAGTSEAALTAEVASAGPDLDLVVTLRRIRPGHAVAMIYAERGIGAEQAARVAKGAGLPLPPVLPTDHSFSDHRVALATALVTWLAALTPR